MALTQEQRHNMIESFKETNGEETAMALAESLFSNDLATKTDIEELRQATKEDIEGLRRATKSDLEELRRATKSDIKELEGKFESRFEKLESKVDAQFWKLASLVVFLFSVGIAARFFGG